MALLSSSSSPPPLLHNFIKTTKKSPNLTSLCCSSVPNPTSRSQSISRRTRILSSSTLSHQLCTDETLTLDRSAVKVREACSEEELWAASCLRVRTFFVTQQEPHEIQYSDNGEDRVVIGSLDLNQCLRLPDEIMGKRPEGLGSDLGRAYLSNVCVAKELQKNGVGSSLVVMSKKVARNWGITDLYVHVAVDNEPARRLYIKSGFIYESDEPAWQARFLDRPRRILLWSDVSDNSNLW